jgi:hypothetical protein
MKNGVPIISEKIMINESLSIKEIAAEITLKVISSGPKIKFPTEW